MTTDDTQDPAAQADLTHMWIGAVPSLDPEGREVILGLDQNSTEPGERLVRLLLNRGHEGEEGVFYLLREDLVARYRRTADRLSVTLLARRDVLAHDLHSSPDDVRASLDALPSDPLDADRLVLLTRELTTDFHPAEQDGEHQPVLLLEHAAAPHATPRDLTTLFDEGEAALAVVNAGLLP
ncbi:hypothetical protein ABT154_15805 [Streptomyces sp. NPDC001728]|uniref:hypothetical protein n=1 Tax=Streptomyces sp. NPDC001728 TaxID=3154396 RepID=UPI003316B3A6